MTIPYPKGMKNESADGIGFQCPCDPESERNDTYIHLDGDVLAGADSCQCGGCGRVYQYRAYISEYVSIQGDPTWQESL